MFSYSLAQQLWELLLNLYWLVQTFKLGSGRISGLAIFTFRPDIRFGHFYFPAGYPVWSFSICGQIPDIETIRIHDIRLISNAGYPVICRISNVAQITCLIPDIRHYKSAGYEVSGQKGIRANPSLNR